MTRSHARSTEGTRAYSKYPANRGGNISLVGAVRLNEKPILYPFDGPVDGDRFLAFLDNHLIPNLTEGDVIILDNCRIHHIVEVAVRLKSVGARAIYLPPYSPELNPIEEAWSLIKSKFKALEARTISAYIDALQIAREAVTSEKIKGYFSHAGYPC